MTIDIIRNNEDPKVETMDECQHRKDRLKWKEYILTKLDSLEKWEVFRPEVQTSEVVKLIGYKWVFIRKCNEKNEITRYQAWIIAQGFSQRPSIDYKEIYSPIMDAIIFRYLICLVVLEGLDLHLMDVIITYLYGSLDDDIYIWKSLKDFKMHKATNSKHCSIYSNKLQRSSYWLNNLKACGIITSMNIWNMKYMCITLFVHAYSLCWIFVIVIVYVEHLNFVGTLEELTRIVDYWKSKFEMQDYGKKKKFVSTCTLSTFQTKY